MKLHKIISGGQAGADITGLECARELGLETGGTAPLGWITENGPNPKLKEFGLIQDNTSAYPPRTRKNVRDADATVWFGQTGSPGWKCTQGACLHHDKPFHVNPTADQFLWLATCYEVINIAGNRYSKNPEVVQLVKAAFNELKGDKL